MKKYIYSVLVLLFLLPLLFSSTSISFNPQHNKFLFTHAHSIVVGDNDTLSYSLSSHNKTFISSSLSFKFLAKRDNYTISVGEIKNDIRIMLLSGDIFSSTRSIYSYNDSINVQLGQSSNTSIVLSFPLKKISIHPFILTHLLEQDKYLSGGVLVDSYVFSSGISFISSIQREFEKNNPLYVFNQQPLIRGLSSFVVFKKDLISLFDIYTLNLRFAIIPSFPFNQTGSISYILNANIQDERHKIEYKSTYYPQYALRWNKAIGKKESYFSCVEYTYYHRWLELSYLFKQEIFLKGLFAYQVTPTTHTYLLSIKGSFYSFSFGTKVEVNEKNIRKEENKVTLSVSFFSFNLSSSLAMKNSSYSIKNKITLKREYFFVSVEIDDKKRISYTLFFDKEEIPFDISFTLDSKKYVQISFTIDQ